MKKILALVLALVMVLGAVNAMAEGSKQEPTSGGTSVSFIQDTEVSKEIIENFKFEDLPENVTSKLPAGFTQINELVTAQFDGDVADVADSTVMNFKFQTAFTAGATVMVLIGVLPETKDGEVEWFDPIQGTVLADGSVNATLPKAIFDKIQNKPFLLGVASEAK